MAPRKPKKGTLGRALDDLDSTELSSILSRSNSLDRSAVMMVMKLMKKTRKERMDDISPLQAAVGLGYFDICKHLIEEGAVLRATFLSSNPHPLCIALYKGHYHIARLLLNAGADIRLKFADKKPMYFALDNSSCTVQIIEDIIKAGFPPSETIDDTSGLTPLHLAVSRSHTSIVKYLLSILVDPNVRDKQGFSPLHIAVKNNNPKMVKLLVKNGAKMEDRTSDDLTPLFVAIKFENYDMIKLLISLGADVHYVSVIKICYTNGIIKACSFLPLQYAAGLCKLDICKILIEKGADVKRTSFTGETALHSACKATTSNKVALACIVQLLIKEGADLEAIDEVGVTPLLAAVKADNISVAKILITSGAKINNYSPGQSAASTFHFVVKTFDEDLIKLCLDYGGDFLAENEDGLYPSDVAVEWQAFVYRSCPQKSSTLFSIVKLFWKHGFPFDEFIWGELESSSNIAVLIQKQKMLFKGLKNCNLKAVKKAFAAGATAKSCSNDIPLPIHYLAIKGNHQIIKEFVSRGVHVNFLNVMGLTPLHLAARSGHIDCCKVLLELGAVYNHRNKRAVTPLELAKINGHTRIIKYLAKVDSYFKALKKGSLKKLRSDMKVFRAVMNCCHRDGMTLMGRAIHLNMKESADHLMKLRVQIDL